MLMPETAVNKYDFASCGEHQVRGAGKIFTIQAIAITHSVDVASNHNFQSSVTAAHRSHNPASGCLFRLRHYRANQLILQRQGRGTQLALPRQVRGQRVGSWYLVIIYCMVNTYNVLIAQFRGDRHRWQQHLPRAGR